MAFQETLIAQFQSLQDSPSQNHVSDLGLETEMTLSMLHGGRELKFSMIWMIPLVWMRKMAIPHQPETPLRTQPWVVGFSHEGGGFYTWIDLVAALGRIFWRRDHLVGSHMDFPSQAGGSQEPRALTVAGSTGNPSDLDPIGHHGHREESKLLYLQDTAEQRLALIMPPFRLQSALEYGVLGRRVDDKAGPQSSGKSWAFDLGLATPKPQMLESRLLACFKGSVPTLDQLTVPHATQASLEVDAGGAPKSPS